ncbi:class I SAM-dependent methyltransferase [Umezawaea sp. Da 62-37]|uniref:class I SAM-dependent methyltransferase n=1 Tax=Umezawaea sp. Da 62-37 TaxID=3075927 RepID=UPI0028F6EB7B|nr:class I SAM-dependent methyltransferase [Umezawaea sp. Da 62-37]WNV87591.1 class I SAM-dependent methyltransferase [Umezawaea sp. Da 62-37]
MGTTDLRLLMDEYLGRLRESAGRYDGTARHSGDMEHVVGDYSAFVTDARHHDSWTRLAGESSPDFTRLVAELRAQSARCAAIMEKYRALNLLGGGTGSAGYFDNVESGIEVEFGTFRLTSSSRVLLVGSGSFPMTPLYIAERTGACVVGVDIDEEAVELGRQVVKKLGSGLDIRLERVPVDDLAFTREASHVIFSSTVAVKYELLHRIHSSTRDDVVVAMRHGDHLKSLFNYPMEEVDDRKWKLADRVLRPEHIFDVALYVKARLSHTRGSGIR